VYRKIGKIVTGCLLSAFFLCTIYIAALKFFSNEDENKVIPSSENPFKNQKIEKILNPLTGLELVSKKKDIRPIAIMINNINKAQPTLGTSMADIIYEIPVEGGITRLMAIYQDPQKEKVIGSIRSARPYYIDIAKGHDAIYVHIGGSSDADRILKSDTIDHFNLGSFSNMMWRDQNRRANLGFEHSAVTSGQKLVDGIIRNGTRFQIDKNKVSFQAFDNNSQVLNGKDTKELAVKFSGYKNTSFNYNEEKGNYLVSQFNEKQMDGQYNCQVERKNVVVLKTKIHDINGSGLKDVELKKGQGIYMGGGKSIDINWKKSKEGASFEYSTKEGQDLLMIPGNIYVCVASESSEISMK
jgi:hypothetical protein